MALLIAIELMTLLFAINTLSSVRTLVGAEGLWSKAQKDATLSLEKYGVSHDEKDYQAYQNYLRVNLGDRKARLELLKKAPDLDVARDGFLEGRFHPDDIDGTIHLVRRFHSISYIAHAIALWSKGDTLISQLQSVGYDLHGEIKAAAPSPERIKGLLRQIDVTNDQLTEIEDGFSAVLGAGSRWLTGLILRLLFGIVLTVEISGLSLTIFVSRDISKGLNEIIRTAGKIATGEFDIRAKRFSNDEIGILASSFNDMTDKLEQNIGALKHQEQELIQAEQERSKVMYDLVERNKDLEQFSYIVSHNLRAPVANILGVAEVIQHSSITKEEEAMMMSEMFNSVRKLDDIIRDLNYTLQIKNQVNEKKDLVKFADLVADIKVSISTMLKHEEVVIITDFAKLDGMLVIKSYLYSIFYNLISNSIKYHRPGVGPVIEIRSSNTGDKPGLTFKDNGMGIDLEKYGSDIFGLYRRFHFHIDGKGMGLYMVKTQVELIGGKIAVSSEVNHGTEFTISFA